MLQAILYVVSVAGLSTLLSVVKRLRTFNRAQRLFRFRYSEQLDVVLTTDWDSLRPRDSLTTLDKVKTQLGYIRGLAHLSSTLSQTRASKPISVHVSEGLDQRPLGDLVLLGGSGGNFLVDKFLSYLQETTDNKIGYDESNQSLNRAHLGEIEVVFDWKTWSESGENLTDFALIVLWLNPFAFKRRRAVWCAGFTAAGTAVAASYVSDSLVARWKDKRRELGLSRWKFPSFAVLLAIEFRDEAEFDVSELNWLPIETPMLPLPGIDVGDKGRYWSVGKRS